MMMKPKDALKKDGKIAVKDGRGRLSREAIERCKELVAAGWQIEGYSISTAAPVAAKSTATSEPVVNKTAPNPDQIYAEIYYTFPENMYKAVTKTGKKPVGMREVCNNCRVSLVQCHCGKPVILGDTLVTIMPK